MFWVFKLNGKRDCSLILKKPVFESLIYFVKHAILKTHKFNFAKEKLANH